MYFCSYTVIKRDFMSRFKIRIGLFLCTFLAPTVLCGQAVTARVAGLESNTKYMTLLQEEQQLRQGVDSIVRIIDSTRRSFASNIPEAEKEQQGAKILQLEKELFEIRNKQGVMANEIGSIEQDFVLKNLNATTPAPATPTGKQLPNLIYNPYFKENLSAEDYTALRHAQDLEPLPLQLLGTYLDNYRQLDSLAVLYDTTALKALAEDTYIQWTTLQNLNKTLSDSLSKVWNYIYDNKTYAYNYLLDKMGKGEMLTQYEDQFRKNRQQIVALHDSVMSDAIYGYPIQKQLVISYEDALAGILGYTAARDSITKQSAIFKKLHYDIPKIDLKERIFIEYGNIERSSPSPYNASHPIPELEVYRQGTVYRILLGSFSQKQAVSIFRGVSPLCFEKTPDNRFRYFAGAFKELSEAQSAQEKLKTMGFRKPEMVVWRNGVYEMVGQDSTANGEQASLYRVEIAGQGETINDAMKETITTQAPGKELSRTITNEGAYVYSVGSFDTKEAADAICNAINAIAVGSATVLTMEN